MDIFLTILFMTISYLLGSIPFGLLIGKIKKVDIRQLGSGNIGSTNTYRVLGVMPGLLAAILDAFKGAVVIILVYFLIKFDLFDNPFVIDGENILILYGFPAVLGHCFSIFLKFKGGKGVATGIGIVLAINGWAALIGLVVFILVVLISRYVSLASTIGAISVTIFAFIYYLIMGLSIVTPIVILLISLLVAYSHISNYKRLIAGTENKIF